MDSIFLSEARVYIAGVLMPTIRVTITCTFNKPPTADITLPAYSELLYLGECDRVPVHIFVRETMVESPEFILLFEGFITSTNYINSALQRSISIQAISFFDILNDVQVKFMNKLDDVYTKCLNGNYDMTVFIDNAWLAYPLYLFVYGLTIGKNPEQDQKEGKEKAKMVKFPSDYLENVYAFMQYANPVKDGGSSESTTTVSDGYTEEPPLGAIHGSALSAYFGAQARRLDLLNRFVRLPYFDTEGTDGYAWQIGESKFSEEVTAFPLIYGMQQHEALNLLVQGANNASPNQSLMELLMYLIEEMEYEYLFITNPAYIGTRKFENQDTEKEESTNAANNGQVKKVASAIATAANAVKKSKDNTENKNPAKLVSSCLKPLFTDTMPPKCNVIYRTMVDNIGTSVIHKGVPTRIQVTNTYHALEKITNGLHPSFLSMYGLVDYYPSDKYPKFDAAGAVGSQKEAVELAQNQAQKEQSTNVHLKYMGTEILKDEKYTGPWVAKLHTPRWFYYLSNGAYKNLPKITYNGEEVPATKVFKERFLRRQLLNLKYFQRQMEIQCTFDPYITPGFPGVVYDNFDSSFAFAGHVVTVVHNLAPSGISTQVAFNFVRPLHEAAEVEIPNPIMSIQEVTHNVTRLSEIYQKILGVNAVTFKDLETLATNTNTETSPNNNINIGYKEKRRNVATFTEYLDFMKLKATYGNGPEGPKTPILLTSTDNHNWLEDRYELPVYDTTVYFDPVIPDYEKVLGAKALSTINGNTNTTTTTTTTSNLEAATNVASVASKIKANADKNAKKEETKKANEETRNFTKIDVRKLLRNVAELEFARMVYASSGSTDKNTSSTSTSTNLK